MNQTPAPNRCRIVLIASPRVPESRVRAALSGGDVASLILDAGGLDEAAFQAFAEQVMPAASMPTACTWKRARTSLPTRSNGTRPG